MTGRSSPASNTAREASAGGRGTTAAAAAVALVLAACRTVVGATSDELRRASTGENAVAVELTNAIATRRAMRRAILTHLSTWW